MRSNTGRAALLVMALSCGCGEPVRAPSPPADASPLDATPPDASPLDASPLDVGEDRALPRDASLSRDAADDLTDAAPDAAPSDRPAVDVAADVTAADAASDAHADGGDDVVDAPPVDAPPPPIEVIITADNAYSFGFGTGASIVTYVQGSRATTAGQIFNCPVGVGPEAYTIPSDAVPSTSHVYIVSWDDLSVTQGVLGQFGRGGRRLYTGDAAWQVCATGIDLARSATGPTQAEVNAQITRCNEGAGAAGTTSQGQGQHARRRDPGRGGHHRHRRAQRHPRRHLSPGVPRVVWRHRRRRALDLVSARRRCRPLPLDGEQHLPGVSHLSPRGAPDPALTGGAGVARARSLRTPAVRRGGPRAR
jgi:hypothetical protein